MPAPSHRPQVTHPHSTGGRTGRESRGDELRRSSRQAGWTAPRSLSRGWPRGKMLPRDSPDPRQGDHSGTTSLPSPHQITTVVTTSLYKDFKTQLLGLPSYLHPGRPPANQPDIQRPGAGSTSSAPSLKKNMYNRHLRFLSAQSCHPPRGCSE